MLMFLSLLFNFASLVSPFLKQPFKLKFRKITRKISSSPVYPLSLLTVSRLQILLISNFQLSKHPVSTLGTVFLFHFWQFKKSPMEFLCSFFFILSWGFYRRKEDRKQPGFFIVSCGFSRLEICTCDAGEIEKGLQHFSKCVINFRR